MATSKHVGLCYLTTTQFLVSSYWMSADGSGTAWFREANIKLDAVLFNHPELKRELSSS